MDVKKTIATIGVTGMIALTMGMTPAMADNGKSEGKGNSVSQAAHNKEKGESNKEAAHAHAPGQVKKVETPAPVEETPAPVEEVPVTEAPVEEVPSDSTPVDEAPAADGETTVGGTAGL